MEDKMRSNRDPEGRALDCADCGGAWPGGDAGYMVDWDDGSEIETLCIDCGKKRQPRAVLVKEKEWLNTLKGVEK